jgi:hypothetical protein
MALVCSFLYNQDEKSPRPRETREKHEREKEEKKTHRKERGGHGVL